MAGDRMGCLTDETVVLFARGGLKGDALAVAEAHLAHCPDCCALVAETVRVTLPEPSSTGAAESSLLPPGATISRYVIEEALGAGGAGVVYRAHDPELGRKVAVKLLPAGQSAAAHGGGSGGRQLREAKAMARLSHPHVVNVYDVGTIASADGNSVFIVMELVPGQNVAQWLRDSPRSWREMLEVYLQAGRGLAAAHGVQLVHRDFKPENVLIGTDGRARVADFGLARLEAPATGAGADPLAGTPVYMAPEQFAGKEADARSDQFSFCVALYASLFGQRPKVPLADPPPSEVPPVIHQALRRGLSADPAARFATMDDLLAALVIGKIPRRRERRLAVVVVSAALAALAVAGIKRWLVQSDWLVTAPGRLEHIAMGYSFTCGVAREGTVWCWGKVGWERTSPPPPRGEEEIRTAPLLIRTESGKPLEGVIGLDAGHTSVCARTSIGWLWCWGENGQGKMGDGRAPDDLRYAIAHRVVYAEPPNVPLNNVVRVACGMTHTCARRDLGYVYCWGQNNDGALGMGDAPKGPDRGARTILDVDLSTFVDLGAGHDFTCGSRADTSLWCWGSDAYRRLGTGKPGSRHRPSPVLRSDGTRFSGVTGFTVGETHGCAITGDSRLHCWGSNAFGQIGAGPGPSEAPAPVPVLAAPGGPDLTGVVTVRAGQFSTCVLKTDRTVACFGDNQYGQLGAGTSASVSSYPMQVTTAAGSVLSDVDEIAAGNFSACARRRDGSLWCWGRNHGGQLGLGDTRDRNAAVMARPARP